MQKGEDFIQYPFPTIHSHIKFFITGTPEPESLFFPTLRRSHRSLLIYLIILIFTHPMTLSTGLVGSLLKQLAQDQVSICADLKIMFEDHKKRKLKPLFDEVSNALCSAAGHFSQVFIIFDPLDECSEGDGCRDKILKLLNRLKVFFTNIMIISRPNMCIEQGFNNIQGFEIVASDEDVRLCLEARILDPPRLH